MGIITPPADRGDPLAGSSQRHRKKVLEVVKNNLTDIIADESIISEDRNKIVKIPIKTLREHRFVFGPNSSGTGRGNPKEGDVIGQIPSDSDGDGQKKPGDKPGIDYYEAEVSLGEILDELFADLELPDLAKKAFASEALPEWELKSFQRMGPQRRMARIPTYKNHLRTKASLKGTIRQAEERKQELESKLPLTAEEEMEYGRIIDFLAQQELLQKKLHEKAGSAGKKRPFLLPVRSEDFRFWHADQIEGETHNASVYLLRDTSGSMSTMERYLSRTFFYFCVKFIKRKYPTVHLTYIGHDTEAQEIPTEDEFMKKASSGGTMISPAYRLVARKMQEQFDPAHWDNYIIHASDGDNWEDDNPIAMEIAADLCQKAKLFAFVQTTPNSIQKSSILAAFDSLRAKLEKESPLIEIRLKSVLISKKEDVWSKFEECFKKQLAGGL